MSESESIKTAVPFTYKIIREGIASGLHRGAQCFIAQSGQPVVDAGMGEAGPGVPMDADVLSLWLSATKPVTAVAVAQQWEHGRLQWETRVADIIPEFAAHHKHRITIGHVLTHTGWFRSADVGWTPRPWDETIARICAARPEPRWKPGERAGYHVDSGWYILGEIVRRLDGRDFTDYVREEIFMPLDMQDSWIGMPENRYHQYGSRIGRVYQGEDGELQEATMYSSAQGCGLCRPGANGRGPVRELGHFYQMLLNEGRQDGRIFLKPRTVDALLEPARVGMFDHTFQHTMDWSLGFILDSKKYGPDPVPYGYGRHCSEKTFGHGGRQSALVFADPAAELVVAIVFNGLPGEPAHQQRIRRVADALYEDLGLA